MSRLNKSQKSEISDALSLPVKERQLRQSLEPFLRETVYRRHSSLLTAIEQEEILKEHTIGSKKGLAVTLYSSQPPESWNPYQVALALFPRAYFCNLTSIYYHALSNQVPSVIYLALEESRTRDAERPKNKSLTDHEIFRALNTPHRISGDIYQFLSYEICLTRRVSRAQSGVDRVKAGNRICPRASMVTCLERALIDAVVHPQYNGGITSVVDYFRNARRRLSVARLMRIYAALNFVYPYWQAIGFFADRAGVASLTEAIKTRYKAKNRFYLDHLPKTSWPFDETWQIFYPQGMTSED